MRNQNNQVASALHTKPRLFPHRTLVALLSCLALCLMTACSKPVIHVPDTPAPAAQVGATWQAYEEYTTIMQAHHAPYQVSASLRYDSRGNGHRVMAHMWSNDGILQDKLMQDALTATSSPLRLDVIAGIGATVAQVREDANSFIMYAPNEKKAYYHHGSRKPLFSLGVPVPFSLADLTDLMLGRFGNVFGTAFDTQKGQEPSLEPHGEIAYSMKNGDYLVLSQEGLVYQWCQEGAKTATKSAKRGWVLHIDYAEPQNPISKEAEYINKTSTPAQLPLPRKLSFTYYGPKGVDHTAIVLIKERQNPDAPFTAEQIALQIPEGTPFYPLQSE